MNPVQIHEIDYPDGRKKIDIEKYIRKSVLDTDYKKVIKENTMILERGKPVILYLVMKDFNEKPIVEQLKKIKNYVKGFRSKGLSINSKIFGYMPRISFKRDYCRTASLSYENSIAHEMLCNLGSIVSDYYKEYCPDMFDFHNEKSKIIKDDWKIEGTPFSSGILNKNIALRYHYDSGNLKDVYSNMVCFKKNCEGGYLVIPEFDIALEISNKSLLLFDGQDIMHGVSPFTLTSMNGYRYTIVYYTLQAMWKCEPITKELARAREVKTARENKRLKVMKGEERNLSLENAIKNRAP